MMRDMVVEILAGVGLVVHQEALIAEPQILDEDSVAGKRLIAAIHNLDAPEPRVRSRVQPERDPMADAAPVAFPDITVIRGAHTKPSFGPHQRQNRRLMSA